MVKHPTVLVPNVGPMDHAWDVLGEWQAELELPEGDEPLRGTVTFRSWAEGELELRAPGSGRDGRASPRRPRAEQRCPSDRRRRGGAPVGSPGSRVQLVAASHVVARRAAPVRA